MSKTPSETPDNYFRTDKGKTMPTHDSSENLFKLDLVVRYLGDPDCMGEICRTHKLDRQKVHYWVKQLRERADLVFAHGSTLRKRDRQEEANRGLQQKILDLEQTVSELRAELEELKSPSADD